MSITRWSEEEEEEERERERERERESFMTHPRASAC